MQNLGRGDRCVPRMLIHIDDINMVIVEFKFDVEDSSRDYCRTSDAVGWKKSSSNEHHDSAVPIRRESRANHAPRPTQIQVFQGPSRFLNANHIILVLINLQP